MKTTVIKWLPAISILGCSLFSTLTADTTHSNSVTAGMMNSSYCPSDCPPKPCPPTCCKPCCKPCPKPCPPPPCPRPCPPPPPPCPQPCPPPPCVPCCEPNPCCPQTPAYGYEVPCNFAILHDAGPRVCDGIDLFFTVDFIWWTARQDGLGYAITVPDTTTPTDSCSGKAKGHVKHPDFCWKPGFKVGLGANLWHDGWDVYAQYTWLHGGSKKSNDRCSDNASSVSGTLIPLWSVISSPDIIAPTFTQASGHWDLHFNVIDIEIGRNFFVSRYVTLRPFSGLKITWQRQDNKNTYSGGSGSPSESNIVRNRSKTWGVGIRPGINANWHFTREFGLFTDWAFTALMTKFNNDRGDKVTLVDDTGTATTTSVVYNNSFYSLKGVLELALGLRYDIWFGCNDAFHFGLSAAWEEQLWINQNNFLRAQEECAHGDLMLHGLTIQARLDF